MATWLDLKDAIRASGRIPDDMVAAIAAARARREVEGFAAIGHQMPYDAELGYQRIVVEQEARTVLDGLEAARFLAAVSPAERAARRLEALAEVADTSIPPRPQEAAEHRMAAAVCRSACYLRWRETFQEAAE